MALATLTIDVNARLAQLEKDLGRVAHVAEQNSKRIESAFDGAAKALKGLGGVITIDQVIEGIKGLIDLGDEMNDLSQKVGINIETLAGWKLAAEQSGTSLESVAKGIKGLSGYIVEHSDALQKAGITARDANGAMLQIADMFASMPDGVEKTAIAVKLFGKAGMDMIPMLNQGSKGLQEALEKSREYGEAVAKLAPHADKFNDQLAELAMYSKVAGINLSQHLVEGLNKTIENFVKARAAGLGFIESLTGLGVRGMNESIDDARNNAGEHIRRIKQEIDDLEVWREKRRSMGYGEDVLKADYDIVQAKKKLEYFKQLQRDVALEKNKASYSNEGRRSPTSEFNVSALLDKPVKESKDKFGELMKSLNEMSATYNATLNGLSNDAPITEAGKKYSRFLADLTQGDLKLTPAQISQAAIRWDQILRADQAIEEAKNAAKGTESVRSLIQKFENDNQTKRDAMTIMPESLRTLQSELRKVEDEAQKARESLEREIKDKNSEEYKKRLKEINDALDRQRGIVRGLSGEQDALNSSWEYGASKALQSYLDQAVKVADATGNAFARGFSMAEDALTDMVSKGKLDLKSLADFALSEFVRLQIVRPGMAAIGGAVRDGSSGGLLSGIGDFLKGLIPSFDVGTPYVQQDTLAFVHKGEAIIPAAFNKGSSGGVVVNLIEAPGKGGQVSQSNKNGVNTLDIMVEQIANKIAGDIGRGNGSVPASMERAYGLTRAAGAY